MIISEKEKTFSGKIIKPTGKKDTEVIINGTYKSKWGTVNEGIKYTIIEANIS